jgi:hypothetical protein
VFALKYIDADGRLLRTAWQSDLSVISNMADFFESEGCEIVSFLVKQNSSWK